MSAGALKKTITETLPLVKRFLHNFWVNFLSQF